MDMNFIESYFRNKINQENLKQRYYTSPRFCECGFPIPSQNTTIHEGFFSVKRVYKEINHTCQNCQRVLKVIG